MVETQIVVLACAAICLQEQLQVSLWGPGLSVGWAANNLAPWSQASCSSDRFIWEASVLGTESVVSLRLTCVKMLGTRLSPQQSGLRQEDNELEGDLV